MQSWIDVIQERNPRITNRCSPVSRGFKKNSEILLCSTFIHEINGVDLLFQSRFSRLE